ncbi:phosphoglycerate mutase [Rhodospirillum rubrum]|uniref:histidine phosphatase family protein n=1 Tax=Rhodospirillum rubrum TaxID=1085 RepID=UPI0019068F43|nr:histidine phosphatase family protein [Rhodospirillum rubrum]MBK1663984.1 phosphoglycerate mutase [Rhodospirillum rubrum]MBK1675458.1 phosphoglycerate mutase [Rhodospirillum rubrum]
MRTPAARPAEATRWWWIRHAPVPDPEGRILGQLDTACDTSDRDVFDVLASRLPGGAVLIVTPLLRTRQTADALELAGARLLPPEEEPAFLEQDFGHWQGRTWGALMTLDPADQAVEAFWRSPGTTAPPAGESFAMVMDRVGRAVEAWSARLGVRDVVAIAHAGTIRAAVAQALGLSPDTALRLVIDPQSLTRIDRFVASGGWAVRSMNETLP